MALCLREAAGQRPAFWTSTLGAAARSRSTASASSGRSLRNGSPPGMPMLTTTLPRTIKQQRQRPGLSRRVVVREATRARTSAGQKEADQDMVSKTLDGIDDA